jgi:probable rRNA maturation factor
LPSLYLRPWRIDIERRPAVSSPISARQLAAAAARALSAAGAPSPASLGIFLSNDRELAALNREHMGEEGPTDVLSFPLLPASAYPSHPGRPADSDSQVGFVLPPGRRRHLGDIVISVERAREQAEQGRGGQTGDVSWSAADEMRLLVTHGVLHVCGWDHAHHEEREAMRALERRLLGDDQHVATSA